MKLSNEKDFLKFWKEKNLSNTDAIKTITSVASVSNNLSWLFFSAYQCAIQYQFRKLIYNQYTSLAIAEKRDSPLGISINKKNNKIIIKGLKTWLVTTNINKIIVFTRLTKPVEIIQKSEKKYWKSIVALVSIDETTKLTTFEKVRYLKKLKQGNIKLNSTLVDMKNILSGKKIKNFRVVEKYFIMLSLTIFFSLKIKSHRLKKVYHNLGNELIDLLLRKKLNDKNLRPLNKKFQKAFDIFDQIPERSSITDWNTDKLLFKFLTK